MDLKNVVIALSMGLATRFGGRRIVAQPLPGTDLVPEPTPEAPRTEAPAQPRAEPRRFGRNVVRALARQGRSLHLPHQSLRECSRRLGGDEWSAYKAADRARRGLGG